MRFILLDKITSLKSGEEIKAVKNVSLAEEYLADHFPTFPVLPGVLLVQGLVESASWLVREKEDYAHSMILLEQASNVRYKSFLAPGGMVEYTVTAKDIDENVSSFKGTAEAGGERIVQAKICLRHFNLADEDPRMSAQDGNLIEKMKERYKLLRIENA
jgi:3-hydroxyacyl-[acyl-carrier-protein] dehydratase